MIRVWRIVWTCFLVGILTHIVNNQKQDERIFQLNKSFEIFKYSNLLKQRTSYKLKCEFTLPSMPGGYYSDSELEKYRIRWFKLDEKNLTILTEYRPGSLKQGFNSENFSNVFISDTDFSSTWPSSQLLASDERRSGGVGISNFSKIRSNLLFRFKNSNEINRASGVYLCKLDDSNSKKRVVQNDSQSGLKYRYFQNIQKITINELINQNEMIFHLNYSILQITNSRLIVEIKQLKTFNHEINTKSKLIYSLTTALGSKQPIVRGQIDMLPEAVDSLKRYLVIESLNPNSTYTLLIYLKTNINSESSYVQLIANTTFQTLDESNNTNSSIPTSSASTSTPNLSQEGADDVEEDEEYDDEDEDDTDYQQQADEQDDHPEGLKRIINCDLIKKPIEQSSNALAKSKSLFKSSNSLFANSKKPKGRSQLLAINYSTQNLNKLIQLFLNRTRPNSSSESTPTLNDFRDFFNVVKFNKDTLDYSTYFDCLKQLKQTSSTSKWLNSGGGGGEPLCLFNFETLTGQHSSAESVDVDYDYYDTSNIQLDDHFSVHASFFLASRQVLVHVSSSCQKRKRPIRNSVSQFNSAALLPETVTATVTGRPTHRQPQFQSIKKAHQLANINECVVFNENEIQFQIENRLDEALTRFASDNSFNYRPYFYHVEILIPDMIKQKHLLNNRLVKSRFRAVTGSSAISPVYYPIWIKFKFKIENSSTQVVRVNLTNIYNGGGSEKATANAKAKSKPTKLIKDEYEGGEEESEETETEESTTTTSSSGSYDDDDDEDNDYDSELADESKQQQQQQGGAEELDEYLYENNRIRKLFSDRKKNKSKKIISTTSNNDNGSAILTTSLLTSTKITYPISNVSSFVIATDSSRSNNSQLLNFKAHTPSAATIHTTDTTISTTKIYKVSGFTNSRNTKFLSTLAEPLFLSALPAAAISVNDYVFRVKVLSEENIQLSEFELNVACKKMSSTNSIINSGLNDGNSSFVGLIMTCICAVVIIIVGSVFCLFIKRKYGLSPEYFLNLKNNFLFRTPSRSGNSSGNSNHTGSNLAKRSKNIHNYHHQAQQYQLETKGTNNNNANHISNNLQQSSPANLKNPTFNYNYVRLLKQKWHNTSNRSYFYASKSAYSISCSSSLNKLDENRPSTSIMNRIRRYLAPLRRQQQQHNGNGDVNYCSVSRSGSSSASSSPLVLFSRTLPVVSTHLEATVDESNQTEQTTKFQSGSEPVPLPTPIGQSVVNGLTYYSTSFTNSIRSKLTSLRNNFIIYKEDHDSIGIDVFESYVQKMHIDGDFGFAQLYEEITAITKTYSYCSDVALLDCNRCKNRYSNILTYDHSRVKLSCDERDESAGYINANYVDGYQKPNAYIATQGPMPNTFGDFWRMIWEKNCSIIVMITNVKEKGRIKCDQYWPEDGAECYSNIHVTHLHTITVAFYTKRIFTIKLKSSKKRCNSERLVYQFHFTDWPDHGVPYYIMPVLTFIKKSSRSNPEFGGPIVVHCSAGVGRTGTYIVIDAMIKQIKMKSTVNIHTFLKHIRHQRNYLVQTEEQFIFIYDALLEDIKSGETELNEHNYKSYLDALSSPINEEGILLIDRQYELISEYKPNDYQISFAQMSCNAAKNRNQKILPVNNSRVILSKNPAIEGSEYINATYLHGCNRQDEFIITQYPLEETRCSFWQMVWDNNSNQIVVLNSDETETCAPYWLPVGEIMNCDSFTVILREENFDMDFVLRDFLLQSIDEDYEFNCRMITACYWPDSCTPIKTSFDLVNKVKLFRMQSMTSTSLTNNSNITAANLPPLIVHDLCGSHRAATFCALFTFQDLIHLENSVNVYEVAKMYHLKRPGLWTNKANIMFLYGAVEHLFDEMHSNNHYQFRNYLNLNIDNHFHNLLYSSHHYYNPNSIQQGTVANTNHVSLTLLPKTNSTNSSLNQQTTVTLPSNMANQQTKINVSNQRNLSINEAIGTRLHNFQSHIQQARVQSAGDMATIPMVAKSADPTTPGNHLKSSLIDIPRILPSFFTDSSGSSGVGIIPNNNNNSKIPIANRRSTSANYRNSKAVRFMNTMRMKSASFKRALFPNSSMNQKQSSPQQQQSSTNQPSISQQLPNVQPIKPIDTPMVGDTVKDEHQQHQQQQQQKPIISLSSGSSSATTSSSSTALCSTPITTATETISFKSALHVSANQITGPATTTASLINNLNARSMSKEKLALT